MNPEILINIERINEAKVLFGIDEMSTAIHYGPIINENYPYALWYSDFDDFTKFLQRVSPRVVHLDEDDGFAGWSVTLQFVENSVFYEYVWESEDFVDFPDLDTASDEDLADFLAIGDEDLADLLEIGEFAGLSSANIFSDLYAIIEQVRVEIDSSGINEMIIESISCFGPKKLTDRRSAVATVLEDKLGEQFQDFDWHSHIWHLYSSVADSLEKKHNSVERALLGSLSDLHRDIRISEPGWDSWTVAGKKKVAASWLVEVHGFESTAVAHELASYRVKK